MAGGFCTSSLRIFTVSIILTPLYGNMKALYCSGHLADFLARKDLADFFA
jgi:hypothetical protein